MNHPPEITLYVWINRLQRPIIVEIKVDGFPSFPECYSSLARGGDRAFHYLICNTYKKSKFHTHPGEEASPPDDFLRPFVSAIQKESKWLREILNSRDPTEFFVYGQRNHKVQLGFSTAPKITILVTPDGLTKNATSDVTESELSELIAEILAPSVNQPSLGVIVSDPTTNEEWEIEGYKTDRSISRGCLVNIHAVYPSGEKAAIFWISSTTNSYQIFPETDKFLGNITSSIKITENGFRDHVIPGMKGFQIDSKSGNECCIIILKNFFEPKELQLLTAKVQAAAKKCVALKSSGKNPTRTVISTAKIPLATSLRSTKKRLEAPPDDTGWETKLLKDIVIPDSTAIMITMPVVATIR